MKQTILLVLVQLVQQRAVDGDRPGVAVGDQWAAHRVHDQAAGRLHDELADRLLRGLCLVGLAAEDLEVPQPAEQGEEQREHQGLHHHQAEPAPALAGRPDQAGPGATRGHQYATSCGRIRRNSRISSGSTKGVTRTS